MPAKQRPDRISVPEVMWAGSCTVPAPFQAHLANQLREEPVDGRSVQSPSLPGEEERRRVRPRAEPVAQPGVLAQCFGRGGVQRHLALLLLLAGADLQRAILKIDIATV